MEWVKEKKSRWMTVALREFFPPFCLLPFKSLSWICNLYCLAQTLQVMDLMLVYGEFHSGTCLFLIFRKPRDFLKIFKFESFHFSQCGHVQNVPKLIVMKIRVYGYLCLFASELVVTRRANKYCQAKTDFPQIELKNVLL